MPEKPVSPFCMCRVFFKIAMPSLSSWGEVFHLSLPVRRACLYPGWGDISDKNQHFAWLGHKLCYFGGEMGWRERGRCLQWAVSAVRSRREGYGNDLRWQQALALCAELLACHGWQASLSPCFDYREAFLWAEVLMSFWRCLQENPVNSWAWSENLISDKQQGKT